MVLYSVTTYSTRACSLRAGSVCWRHRAVLRMEPLAAVRCVLVLVLTFFVQPPSCLTSSLIVLDDTQGLGRVFDGIGGLSAGVH